MLPEAKARYDEAMKLYAAHQYRAAIVQLEAAYAIDPRREILFAQAQATRLAGDCAAALPHLRSLPRHQPAAAAGGGDPHRGRPLRGRRAGGQRTAAHPGAAGRRRAAASAAAPLVQRSMGRRARGARASSRSARARRSSTRPTPPTTRRAARPIATTRPSGCATRPNAAGPGAWAPSSADRPLIVGGAGRYVWVGMHPKGGVVSAGTRF
jgi:hypothetical protein